MDCLTSLANEAVSKLGELIVESTIKQFKYLLLHKKITTNLEEEFERLKMTKQALQVRVDTEYRRGYEIAPNVQKWLSDVTEIEKELQTLLSNENKFNKNKKCFGGQCPNLAFNYSLGKQATKSTEYITSLKEEENKFQVISYPKAPLTLGSTFTKDIKSLLSRKKIITEVIEKLKDDQVKMISICGMGGVGKTTLVKEVIKTIETNKLFDEVLMVVVSQVINYENIQVQIAESLGMQLKNVTEQGRKMQLLERLIKCKRVLIVLDDVWEFLDFDRIGLPYRENEKSCKILITSRDEKVCQKMGCKVNFQVSVLSENEVWYLFREMAGEVVDKPDINPIAREIAKECGGLPLAIVTIARALSIEGKSAWDDALRQLKKSQSSSLSDVGKSFYPSIELSLKALDSKKHMFFLIMLCGLFPEDFDIPIESLLHHAMGLGLFKGISASWEARNRVHTLVSDLKRKFLLLDSNVSGCVKMHDIVRDVVISVTFKNSKDKFMVQYNIKSLKEEKLNNICAISLILDDTNKLENGLECPKLKLLLVRSKRNEPIFWPEGFFQGMNELKVLSMQNLCIPKLPSLSRASINLHTLQVEYCDVGDISIIGKELVNLEVLSFAYSKIKELPFEIGNLHNLRLLDLTDCNDLAVISTNVLERLSRLEELYLRMNNFPWKKNEDAINELKRISHQLKVLEMKIWETGILVMDFDFSSIQKFWVNVDHYTNIERSAHLESNLLQINAIGYLPINSMLMISQLIKKCEILSIIKAKDLKNIISQLLCDVPIPYLKDLRVDSCPNLEYLIDCTIHSNGFKLLQSLSLKNLENLRYICHTSNNHEGMLEFPYLMILELIDLPSFIGLNQNIEFNELDQELSVATELIDTTNVVDGEKLSRFHSESKKSRPSPGIVKLFSSNWMKQFPKLEMILLKNCISLEVVFDLEGYLKSSGQELDLLFPQLTKIEISHLKNLSYVWSVVPCCVQGFQNLKFLTISSCHSLKHVFTSTIVKAVTNLEKLEVKYCALVENIVVWNRDEEEYDNKGHVKTIGFNKLWNLSLSNLPKLVSICSDPLWLECPSLKQFEIDDCPMLEMSFLPIHINVGFQSFKENNSRSSMWSPRCIPFIPKFIHQGNQSQINSKEESITQIMHDHEPSILEMESRKGKSHMPVLEDLYIVKCNLLDVLFLLEEKSNFTILSYMKTIKIQKCNKLKSIVVRREKKEGMINSFDVLESLHLENLPNLERLCFFGTYDQFWDKQQSMDKSVGDHISIKHHLLIDESLFPNLTSLFIEECNKISILFSHSSIGSLEHLQKLEVSRCKNMEEIISQEEETETSSNKIMFPALQHLILKMLPKLKAFFQGRCNLDFPSLQKVTIYECPNMEVFSRGFSYTPKLEDLSIVIGYLRSNYEQKKDINSVIQGFKAFVASQGFKMLNWTKLHTEGYLIKNSKINFYEFPKLLILVPYNEIHMLQHVKKLSIYYCDSLLEVFESGGKGTKESGDITYYQLQEMTLSHLPKLSHIWKHNITKVISFQNLKNISVSYCFNLKSLLSHSMARSLVQLQELEVKDCYMMEEIITNENENIKGGNKVKILFPKLEKLKLHDLPNLESVCSGDYDYDLLMYNVRGDKEINNNYKLQISFPQLKVLYLLRVPKLKCFCSGAYDYNIMEPSIKECSNTTAFPHGNIILNTPNLHTLQWNWASIHTLGDLNLTIYYFHDLYKYKYNNFNKYEVELQKLETFRDMDEELVGYIKRVTRLNIIKYHKLLNCIPSDMLHIFSHVEYLTVEKCECLEEIFESNDGDMQYQLKEIYFLSLPKLKHIWKNHCKMLRLECLTWIIIKKCNDLEHVLPDVSMVTSLPYLSWIDVSECEKIEEIIGNNWNPIQPKANIIFPSLIRIDLDKLPSLKCFSRSSLPCYVELPQCEWVSIRDCREMKTFWYEGILYTPRYYTTYVNDTRFDKDEDVNEVIQQHNK